MLTVCLLISAMKITQNGTVLCGLLLKPYNLSLIVTEAPETLTLGMVNKIYDRHSSSVSKLSKYQEPREHDEYMSCNIPEDMMNTCHVISWMGFWTKLRKSERNVEFSLTKKKKKEERQKAEAHPRKNVYCFGFDRLLWLYRVMNFSRLQKTYQIIL